MTKYKSCTVCKQNKALSDFGFNNREKNWYKSQCKACDTKRMAVYKEKNRDKISASKKRYYLQNHDDLLLKYRQYRLANRERSEASNKIWREKNAEYLRLYARNRKGQRKAARIGVVTSRDVAKILSKPCIYCGSEQNLQLEHVIPIARGGSHSIGNLAPACKKCNMSKNKWFVMEWKLRLKKWGTSF